MDKAPEQIMYLSLYKAISQLINFLVLFPVYFYRYFIKPFLPPACRFEPSCSEYTIEAVKIYGVFKGIGKALWRLLRCHPGCKGGFDPVINVNNSVE